MTAKEKVLAKWPKAYASRPLGDDRMWIIYSVLHHDAVELGRAYDTQSEAWADAASRLAAVPASKPNADEVIRELEEALRAMKIRIAFIGWPKEPMNEDGPDWSRECVLLEAALSRAAAYRKEKERG